MLTNRVDPTGKIFATTARGQWMGNRGCIHSRQQTIAKPFALHAWITCRLAYKNQRLPLMSGHHNTQLFFYDEATALSAGHRPCAFCRREAFTLFKKYWLIGNPAAGLGANTTIKPMDDYMHAERIGPSGEKKVYTSPLASLPPGVFILQDEKPCLINIHALLPWTPAGYSTPIQLPTTALVTVLTPLSIVNTLRAGYLPQMGRAD
ncbi:MAG TPA: hypothetical protein VL307_00205 [Chitinophagaceae bacterium]|nr:hypothetical protein [Chitinophagaceae bacterium]